MTDTAPARVLYLEDDPNDAELTQRELRKLAIPVTVHVVNDSTAFTRSLTEFRPDLVISDHSVPGYGGLLALAAVRSLAPHVPFILVTGSLGEETAVEYMKAGAVDYILKDRLTRLGPAVLQALDRERARREARGAVAARREVEDRLRAVVRATNDAVWDWDLKTDALWWNEGLQLLFGYDLKDVESTLKWWSDRVHPEDRDRVMAGVRAVIGAGGTWRDEYRFRCADGRYATVLDRGHILADQSGAPARMIGAMVDVSERRKLEDQLLQAQKMEAVGRLAGGVAHDFNNILTAILGHAELLLTDFPAGDQRRDDLTEIHKAATRAAGLTHQLLAFSRKQVLQPRPLDLNAIVANLEGMLRRLIGEDMELLSKLAPDVGIVHADPSQVEQVIMNLVVNARDAMPQGGKLTIETANVELDEPYVSEHPGVQAGPYVLLAVSDTGVGMDDETRAHLFEPFFTTKAVGKGTGLGLATIHGVVNQSGGHIWVYTEPGSGTTFKVYLPRTAGRVATAAPRPPAESLRGTETVLVVDDEPAVREVARKSLAKRGYTVLVAPDGAEALRIVATHQGPLHLVVTDLVMPGMSGLQLGQRVTAARPDLKVLYLSGYSDQAIIRNRVLEPGMDYLQKPFTPAVLAERVRSLLDRR